MRASREGPYAHTFACGLQVYRDKLGEEHSSTRDVENALAALGDGIGMPLRNA